MPNEKKKYRAIINWGYIPSEIGGDDSGTPCPKGIPAHVHDEVEHESRVKTIRKIAESGGDDILWFDIVDEDDKIVARYTPCGLYPEEEGGVDVNGEEVDWDARNKEVDKLVKTAQQWISDYDEQCTMMTFAESCRNDDVDQEDED
jgi:hypothetical protein